LCMRKSGNNRDQKRQQKPTRRAEQSHEKTSFFRACPAKRIDSPWTKRELRHNANKITPCPPEGLVKSAQKVSLLQSSQVTHSEPNTQPDPHNVQRLKIHRHAHVNARTSGLTFTSVVPIWPNFNELSAICPQENGTLQQRWLASADE
jgi:hypothetical protein